ncbi:MAG: dihydrofolate reductase family protein [Alphaproteobacteria bacterium]
MSLWIKYIHLIRAKHDGLLIGSGTYKKDNPRLTVRLEGYNKKLHKFFTVIVWGNYGRLKFVYRES